ALFVLVLPPAPACLGPVQKSLAAKMPQRAESAARSQMPQVAHGGREAIGERRHVNDLRIAAGVIHRAHFVGVQSQRLLTHDMLAMLRRGERDWFMRE